MERMTAREIESGVKGRLLQGSPGTMVTGISIDSRTCGPGDAFFALSGDRFDGHDFLCAATDSGCALLVVSQREKIPAGFSGAVVLAVDTTEALQDLAAAWLLRVKPVTVAITGSVGKTTVKDMIAWVCSDNYKTVWSKKNFNNHIGVPLTIFEVNSDTEALILEMGMNHPGEIRRLAGIARPDIAVITNVGLAHSENFDSEDGIFKAKMEVADFMGENCVLVLNGDDPKLSEVQADSKPYGVLTAGTNEGSDYVIRDICYNDEGNLRFNIESADEIERFILPAAGIYNGVNAGLAVAALSRVHISMSKASSRLRNMERTPQRLERKQGAGFIVIDDTYNASPDSMKSGIDYLVSLKGERHVAILAGMRELGDDSAALHREVGDYAIRAGVDMVAAVGERAEGIFAGASAASGEDGAAGKARFFPDKEEACGFFRETTREGDVFLVKGSRGEKMEDVVGCLMGIEWDDNE